jgi:GNAT superfamily N-acetyltransferase
MTVEIRRASGALLKPYLPEVASLRIRVFREYPYLYDGSEDYERRYLQKFARSERAVAVLAIDTAAADGQQVVGVSTGLPLRDADAAFHEPFGAAGIDSDQVFYCAESVLLPAYRGRGLYRAFFAGREAHAADLGCFNLMTFCAVVRPPEHPLCPVGYRPLDPTWRRLGYQPHQDLIAHYNWKDIDRGKRLATQCCSG